MRLLYTLLIRIAAPIALVALWLRSRRDPDYRRRALERLGYAPPLAAKQCLWIHAVSVGEVRAAAVLIPRLKVAFPDYALLVTTVTPTGARQIADLFGTTVQHRYLPYDTPGAVRRFLERVHPALALILETEIWPNLYRACRIRGIPVLIASARLSARSTGAYRMWRHMLREVLAENVTVAAQTEADAERYREIGVPAARTFVGGNVKFDLVIPEHVGEAGKELRTAIGTARPLWVAGSTREHEEEQILEAQRRVQAALPDALLVLVPRHPQRFATVKLLLERKGIAHVTWSSGAPIATQTGVLLVDTLGELLKFYAAADLGFVGGTLVPVGGHNLLEPAALGLPVLTGPHVFNAPEVARLLLAAGGAIEVRSAAELGDQVIALLRSPADREARGKAGIAVIGANRGAVERVMALVSSMLASSHAPPSNDETEASRGKKASATT